jgi:hypothetical protein
LTATLPALPTAISSLSLPERAAAGSEQQVCAQVAGHDDDSVGEGHGAALAVGQAAVVEDLQQHVEDVVVRLLDLLQQHHIFATQHRPQGELSNMVTWQKRVAKKCFAMETVTTQASSAHRTRRLLHGASVPDGLRRGRR